MPDNELTRSCGKNARERNAAIGVTSDPPVFPRSLFSPARDVANDPVESLGAIRETGLHSRDALSSDAIRPSASRDGAPDRPLLARLQPSGWGSGWAWAALVVIPALIVVCHLLVGLRVEHVVIGLLFLILAWVGPRARRFSALAAPFVATGVAYDFLRLLMPYRAAIHTGDLFDAERWVFPMVTARGIESVSEVVARWTHPALDLLTGPVYLTYLLEVFGVATWFYLRGEYQRMQRLAFGFALANLVGWAVWLAWPAAPPWYVDAYGPGPASPAVAASPAGGARFDALVGLPLFANLYARSSNVFGAMPSLHVCYGVLTALTGWSAGRAARWFTLVFAVVLAFAAMYLRHHYILDIVAGALLAFAVYGAVVAVDRRLQSRGRRHAVLGDLGQAAAPWGIVESTHATERG